MPSRTNLASHLPAKGRTHLSLLPHVLMHLAVSILYKTRRVTYDLLQHTVCHMAGSLHFFEYFRRMDDNARIFVRVGEIPDNTL